MTKLFVAVLGAVLLSGCGLSSSPTHNIYLGNWYGEPRMDVSIANRVTNIGINGGIR